MKPIVWLFTILIFMISGCASTSQRGYERGSRDFFTPRNWEIPIIKDEAKPAPAETGSETVTPVTPTPPVKLETTPPPELLAEDDEQMIGHASWYGPGFHGEKTANGETYDQEELTAAHKLLPMNTWVQVTNLENDKTVIVRINDRGPYKKNRVIDLTRKGAEVLGFENQGTARVALKVIRYPKDYDPSQGLTPYKLTIVQVAVFSTQERADAYKLQLSQMFTQIPFIIETQKELFYVLAGPYEVKSQALQVSNALKAEGIENFVRSYKK